MSAFDTTADVVDEDVPSLPLALSTQLPSRVAARFHSAAASRLALFDGPHRTGTDQQQRRGGTRVFDFQFDVVVGQMKQVSEQRGKRGCTMRASACTARRSQASRWSDALACSLRAMCVRQLLHGWHTIFCQLQSSSSTLNPRMNPAASVDEWHVYLLSVSRAYRAELEACLTAAAEEIQPANGHIKQELKQELREKNVSMSHAGCATVESNEIVLLTFAVPPSFVCRSHWMITNFN
jgi:hypothetical protein